MDARLAAILAFLRRPIGSVDIGALHPQIRNALTTPARSALLSAATMAKQARNHPELTLDDYLLIPPALLNPTVIAWQMERRVVLFRAGARILRIAAKATENRTEVYVTSFHFTDLRKTRRFLRTSLVVFGDAADLER